MPVGCLGVSSRSGAADSSLYLNQVDSGWAVMAGLVRVNSEAVWCPGLVRAVNSLRYQVREL